MFKASVIGIDNTGKTSLVKSFQDLADVETIYLTDYRDGASRFARKSGWIVKRLAHFGEYERSRAIAGMAYLLHLWPYKFEERKKRKRRLPFLVSDRDPIVDTLVYSRFYLPAGVAEILTMKIKSSLESVFSYPDVYLYLHAFPETAARRYKRKPQLHERIRALSVLRDLYEEQIASLRKAGVPVHRINTEGRTLEAVSSEVKRYLLNGCRRGGTGAIGNR